MPTDFNNVSALSAATVSASVSVIKLLGYYVAADGAGHLRKRGSNVPSAIQSADGAYWEYLSEDNRYDIRHFGAKVDGSTDDTLSINVAIGALPKITGSYSVSSAPELYFPAGRTITQGGHSIPSDKKCRIVGDGSYTSVIQIINGYAGSNDMITVNSNHSSVENVMLDGNRAGVTGTQDGIVVNAALIRLFNLRIASFRGSGIVVGKSSSGINVNVAMVDVRYCIQYGVNIVAGESTDGAWTNVNVGGSGLSGFNLATGAQKMVNCHSWGNGLESTSDNSGFNIRSGANMLSSCESESNLGDGITIRSFVKFNAIVGSTVWGNCLRGLYLFNQASNNTISGCSFRNNGVNNSSSGNSVSFSHVLADTSFFNVISGNSFDDDSSALTQAAPAFPSTYTYPGRASGVSTSAYCYAELNGSNDNVISGNSMQASHTTSGASILSLGSADVIENNATGLNSAPNIASSAALTIPASINIVKITGTSGITSIQAGYRQRRVTLIFQSAGVVVTNGSNLLIGSNYTSTVGSTLTLICDGTSWYRG